jgi:hypothetical protein
VAGERREVDKVERTFDHEEVRSAAPDLTRLAEVAERARPVALAREQVLPVLPPLEVVLPGGLRRGTTVGVGASTSLALAVLAGPVQDGSWIAAVGVSSLGLAAASELGVSLDRLVLVAAPPADAWATVVATLVDAFDAVLVRPHRPAKATDARRLAARARERGAVLVVLDGHGRDDRAWPEAPEVRMAITASEWVGLGAGHGHLRARRVVVEADGRRAHARPRRAELWLPAAGGGVAVAEPLAVERPLKRARGS